MHFNCWDCAHQSNRIKMYQFLKGTRTRWPSVQMTSVHLLPKTKWMSPLEIPEYNCHRMSLTVCFLYGCCSGMMRLNRRRPTFVTNSIQFDKMSTVKRVNCITFKSFRASGVLCNWCNRILSLQRTKNGSSERQNVAQATKCAMISLHFCDSVFGELSSVHLQWNCLSSRLCVQCTHSVHF